jgi:hypothetical protein
LPERGDMNQQLLPFHELKDYSPHQKPDDAVILFHITQEMKDDVAKVARLQAKSITGLLNLIIGDYLESFKQLLKPKKPTGRGHVDLDQLEKAKELLRKKHPEGVRAIEVANHAGCSQARARGLLDLLSGHCDDNENTVTDFLVYEDSEVKPTRYYIYKDDKLGIKP